MKVILMLAMTVDGKIARTTDHAADWTSKEDKKAFMKATKEAGAVIMGRNTFDTIGRPLPDRLNFILTSTPQKYKDKTWPDLLEFFKGSPQEVISELSHRKYKKAVLGGGASVNQSFLENGLVDEMHLTIEPKLFGRGVNLFTDSLDVNLALRDCVRLNNDSLQLKYTVIK